MRLARTVYHGNRYDDPFVGRTKEALEFRRFVKEHRMILNDSGRDGDEGVEYARNVLVFYGVGGVGKTALSQELEKWVNNERSNDVWGCIDESVDVTARIDLHRSQGNVDPVEMVLAIRRMLGGVKKKWVAGYLPRGGPQYIPGRKNFRTLLSVATKI